MQVVGEKRRLCHVVGLQPYLPAAPEGAVAPHPLLLRNLAVAVVAEALHPLLLRSPVAVVAAVAVVLQTVLPLSLVVVAAVAVEQRYCPLNRLRQVGEGAEEGVVAAEQPRHHRAGPGRPHRLPRTAADCLRPYPSQ